MSCRALLAFSFLSLASAPGLAADGDIAVDLAMFKFKVDDNLASLFGYNADEGKLFYYAGGAGETKIKLPADGNYEIVIKASCDPALAERAKFRLAVAGEAVGQETLLTEDGPKEYKLELKGKAGEHTLAIEYTNDVYKEGEYDRNFYVHGVTVKPVK
jgi:hypothetical protein